MLAISDAQYDSLSPMLKEVLTEYYRVDNMEDYDQMYRAVAYFAFKYGKIDWIESNNEYWLGQDARLRTDFNVTTGIGANDIATFKEKSAMKAAYAKGGIPTARQQKARNGFDAAIDFAKTVGYPMISKPDVGVGAEDTYKIHNDDELRHFFDTCKNWANYVLEEFITGNIFSYDAIINSKGEPIFESMSAWPPSIMDIVNKKLELSYYVDKEVPEALRAIGRRTVDAFGVTRRFVHLEFFRLSKDHGDLGKTGDFVGLEVNMRPPGGYTPDMMNYAHSTNVFKIWADMVAFDECRTTRGDEHLCVYTSRRDIYDYAHTPDDIRARYGDKIVMSARIPDVLAGAMGNEQYTARLDSIEEVREFIDYVTAKV